MKQETIVKELRSIGNDYTSRRIDDATALTRIVSAIEAVDGLTGICCKAEQKIRLRTQSDVYSLPIQAGAKTYNLIIAIARYLIQNGASQRNIELHLGPACSTKHHHAGLSYTE